MAVYGSRDNPGSRARFIAIILSCFAVVSLTLLIYTFGRLPATRNTECYNNISLPSATPVNLAPAGPDTSKIATIIENRPLANLIPLILSFSAVLGSSWPIRVFHSPQNAMLFENSPPIRRLRENGQLSMQLLPGSLNFSSHEPVSAFLATTWLWERLAPAKHVLMFQTDSILCGNSLRRVDDFLEYDFIGAPINTSEGTNYNGGLCLRNREKILEVLQHFERPRNGQFEDQWFAEKLRELPANDDGGPSANLPSMEVASQFAVETIWAEKPFGMHQISRWHPEHLKELKAWCPEYQLAIEGGLHPFHNKDVGTLDVPSGNQSDTSSDTRR
ncbi:MAG: hypothetical protein Q9220_001643 [cf. Caloplaca sp. 1 TL-2023]